MCTRERLPVTRLHVGHQASVFQIAHGERMIPAKDRHVGKVPAAQYLPVVCRNGVLRAAGLGIHGGQIERRADLGLRAHRMAQLHDPCLCEHHVMVHLVQLAAAGQHTALGQTDGTRMQNHGVLLVDGQPILDLIAVFLKQYPTVRLKRIDGRTVEPAALLFQAPRQVKVIHGHDGLDIVFAAGTNDCAVVLDTRSVDFSGTVRQNARPSNRKAVCLESHLGKQRNVFLKAVIMVACDRKIGIACRVLVHINDRRALAVGIPSTLDLIGRGGRAPQEILRKIEQFLIDHKWTSFLTSRSERSDRA